MKLSSRISIVVLVVSIIAVIVSAIVLPDTVQVQHSAVTGIANHLPKLWAILLAAVLSIAGAVGVLLSKKEEPKKFYPLTISIIGVILFLYMIVVNCIIKYVI